MRLNEHKHSSSAHPTMDELLVLEDGWAPRQIKPFSLA